MTYLTAFLLGLVQGVAEFLPISSSGHLAIAQNLLGMQEAGSVPEFFDVLLHLGTLIAVFAAYWKDICEMVVELFRGIGDLAHRSTPSPVPPARRLILLIVVGTLPLFAVLPIRKAVQGLSDNMVFVGAALIVTGILLFLCDRVRKGRKTERSATWVDALLVGVGQAVATLPGVSRSGMTITAGCFVGYERRAVLVPAEHPRRAGRQHPVRRRRGAGRHQRRGGAHVSGGRRYRRRGGVSVHPPAEICGGQGPLWRVCLLLLGGGHPDIGAAGRQVR